MIFKLSEIFISQSGIYNYSVEVLYTLKLNPVFIEKMTCHFKLTCLESQGVESNLCFANNKEVSADYRITFSKADVLNNIFFQLSAEAFNLEKEEVVFKEDFLVNNKLGKK
ncbi:MAG: hypothetical protein ACRBG0_03740 [Lewinella sp.]|uniref:hypothetical protein n=1 Tax=Lewinella sp. TaxID=2004506 RepID=UPI003D6BD8CC